MRSVVRTGKEVRPGSGEAPYADRQGGPDRGVVAFGPVGKSAGQCDAVQGDLGMVVGAEVAEALLAERPEAQRGSFRRCRQNPQMPHRGSQSGQGPNARQTRALSATPDLWLSVTIRVIGTDHNDLVSG